MEKLKQRILSLDVFRGATVAAMILVNNPGSWGHIYPPLAHAEWNGCTPTDLIFPFFIFIVGVSIVFSLDRSKQSGEPQKPLLIKIARRSIILFLLGLLMALFPGFDFATVRIPGVLQRIAVVFLVSSILFLKTGFRTQFILFLFFLFFYWFLMTVVPVPGIGPANLEAGTNLAAWLDRLVITEAHTWKSTKTWDPEGVLSTIPAISTCLGGVLTAQILRRKNKSIHENLKLIAACATLAILSGVIWGFVFPINKSLWTSSFVLFTGGLAALILSALYWWIDLRKKQRWTAPFVAFGVNAITVFFFSGIAAKTMNLIKVGEGDEETGLKTFLYKTYFLPNFSEINASLAWAICFVLCWFLILWVMYKRNVIIKI